MKWRKIFFRRMLRFRRRHTYLALGGIIIAGLLLGSAVYQAYNQLVPNLPFGGPAIKEKTLTSAPDESNAGESSVGKNVAASPSPSPAPAATPNPTATAAVPQVITEIHNYPSGSESQPIKQSDKVTTTCKGAPRSTCHLRAVHAGDGAIIDFAARPTDETGIASWVWSPSADGFTQGGIWNISATIGQQTSNSAPVYIAGQVNAL
jgi:hypothetical protein